MYLYYFYPIYFFFFIYIIVLSVWANYSWIEVHLYFSMFRRMILVSIYIFFEILMYLLELLYLLDKTRYTCADVNYFLMQKYLILACGLPHALYNFIFNKLTQDRSSTIARILLSTRDFVISVVDFIAFRYVMFGVWFMEFSHHVKNYLWFELSVYFKDCNYKFKYTSNLNGCGICYEKNVATLKVSGCTSFNIYYLESKEGVTDDLFILKKKNVVLEDYKTFRDFCILGKNDWRFLAPGLDCIDISGRGNYLFGRYHTHRDSRSSVLLNLFVNCLFNKNCKFLKKIVNLSLLFARAVDLLLKCLFYVFKMFFSFFMRWLKSINSFNDYTFRSDFFVLSGRNYSWQKHNHSYMNPFKYMYLFLSFLESLYKLIYIFVCNPDNSYYFTINNQSTHLGENFYSEYKRILDGRNVTVVSIFVPRYILTNNLFLYFLSFASSLMDSRNVFCLFSFLWNGIVSGLRGLLLNVYDNWINLSKIQYDGGVFDLKMFKTSIKIYTEFFAEGFLEYWNVLKKKLINHKLTYLGLREDHFYHLKLYNKYAKRVRWGSWGLYKRVYSDWNSNAIKMSFWFLYIMFFTFFWYAFYIFFIEMKLTLRTKLSSKGFYDIHLSYVRENTIRRAFKTNGKVIQFLMDHFSISNKIFGFDMYVNTLFINEYSLLNLFLYGILIFIKLGFLMIFSFVFCLYYLLNIYLYVSVFYSLIDVGWSMVLLKINLLFNFFFVVNEIDYFNFVFLHFMNDFFPIFFRTINYDLLLRLCYYACIITMAVIVWWSNLIYGLMVSKFYILFLVSDILVETLFVLCGCYINSANLILFLIENLLECWVGLTWFDLIKFYFFTFTTYIFCIIFFFFYFLKCISLCLFFFYSLFIYWVIVLLLVLSPA